MPGLQPLSCSQAVQKIWSKTPRVLRPDVIASFSAKKRKQDDFSLFSVLDSPSEFSTPVPTKRQFITEHDHCINSRSLDMDSGENEVGQSSGELDSR